MLLAAAGLAGAAAGDVETGLLYGSPQTWYPASGAASMPFMVACRRPAAPRSATCTLSNPYMATRTQGAAWVYLPASSCWLVYSSIMQEGPTQPNCMWHAEFTLQVPRADSPWLTETQTVHGDFQVKNVEVNGITVISATPETLTVVDLDPFVTLHGEGALHWSVAADDGSEEPALYPVTGNVSLVRILDSDVVGPPPAFCESQTRVVPTAEFGGTFDVSEDDNGVYYQQFTALEAPADGSGYLSTRVQVEQVAPHQWESIALRHAQLMVDVTTTDTGGQNAITESSALWFDPDGAALLAGFSLANTNTTELHAASPRTFALAGTYGLAVACRDSYADGHHEGRARWARPALWSLEVPAATCVVGRPEDGPTFVHQWVVFGGEAEQVYATLGWVSTPPNGQATFYSARPPEGARGGVVREPPGAVLTQALQEDDVVTFSGHGIAGGVFLNANLVYYPADELADLPAGACERPRVVWVSACESWVGNPTPETSVCGAILAKRSGPVVGYTGSPSAYWSAKLTERAFHLMCREGYSVKAAVDQARTDVVTNPLNIGDSKVDTVCCEGSDACLAPAFPLPAPFPGT